MPHGHHHIPVKLDRHAEVNIPQASDARVALQLLHSALSISPIPPLSQYQGTIAVEHCANANELPGKRDSFGIMHFFEHYTTATVGSHVVTANILGSDCEECRLHT